MKSIFLVNPISGRGHLDAYARLYSRAFVELGYRVVLIAETDGDAPGYFARNAIGQEGSFSFVSFAEAVGSQTGQTAEVELCAEPLNACATDTTDDCGRSAVGSSDPADACSSTACTDRARLSARQRAALVWCEEGPSGILLRLVVVPRRLARRMVPPWVRLPLIHTILAFRRGRSLVFRSLRPLLMDMARPTFRLLMRFRFWREIQEGLNPDLGRIRFEPMLDHVRGASVRLGGLRPDLIVVLYLDLMGEGLVNVGALDAPGGAPWVGILFHPRLAKSPELPIEGYFRSRNARGGIFLVPGLDAYRQAAPHLKFVLAPDVCDLEIAAETPAVASEIRRRAAGRTIVLQAGTIAPHKGIATLLEVIAKADKQRFFFAMVGEVHWHTFGADEARLRAFYASPPENVYVLAGYLKEERDYNALIASCDLMYAVYSGFNSSSNSLSKAAGLRRPILVAKNTLMGTRVTESGIGLAAAEGDAEDILRALERLVTGEAGPFSFDRYSEEHSIERLKLVLAEPLAVWMQ